MAQIKCAERATVFKQLHNTTPSFLPFLPFFFSYLLQAGTAELEIGTSLDRNRRPAVQFAFLLDRYCSNHKAEL